MGTDASEFERELKTTFLEEAEQCLAETEQSFLKLERAGADREAQEELLRLAHNLKGTARAVGFEPIAQVAHKLETLLGRVKSGELAMSASLVTLLLRCHDWLARTVALLRSDLDLPIDRIGSTELANELAAFAGDAGAPAPAPTVPGETPGATEPGTTAIRVPLSKIDRLLNDMGELVVLKTILVQHQSSIGPTIVRRTIAQLEKTTRRIQNVSLSLRMVPIEGTFLKMHRIVRDVSQSLGKRVELSLSGLETEIDKLVLEQVSDPLMHLVRNAIDHGLESPAERAELGKPPGGKLQLSAYHRGNQVILECRDDGRGLDERRIVQRARERGLIPQTAQPSGREAQELIFLPGFSTANVVSEISGRGVGMDVVKTNVSRLGGKIEIETSLGKGTCFRLLLPFTLSIIEGMVIRVGEERYVIPLSQVQETLPLSSAGKDGPCSSLAELLGRPSPAEPMPDAIVMVLKSASSRAYPVLVDDILGQQQVVTKRLGEEIDGIPGITGSAILGDGRPALVIDALEMIAHRERGGLAA